MIIDNINILDTFILAGFISIINNFVRPDYNIVLYIFASIIFTQKKVHIL